MSIYLRSYIAHLARVMGSEELPEAALEYVEAILGFPVAVLLDNEQEKRFIAILRDQEEYNLKVYALREEYDHINKVFLNAVTEARLDLTHA
jgi:hypothetical protein